MHGLIDGLDERIYHAHPALSNSGAKALLPPSCPAKFKWERDNGRPPKREFDLGSAVHKEVLGVGGDVVVCDFDSWRTKAAQEEQKAAYAAGKIPILTAEMQQVRDMAEAVRRDPMASVLFDPERGGKPEQSLFWHDERHSIDRRARLDWLPSLTESGRLIVPDLKTAKSAEPSTFANDAFNWGYEMQSVFYTDAIHALELAEDVAFVFVAIEKTPPYLITVHDMDDDSWRIGRERVDQACAVFADCTANDTWPGYSTEVNTIRPPKWALYKYGDVA